jgi:signal transduction histidine kinase
MSEAGPGAPPRAFVHSLLRSGTPAEHSELTEDIEDTGGVGRIGAATLARAWRYAVVGPLLYRIAGFVKVFVGFVGSNGRVGLLPAALATVFGVAASVGAVVWVLRVGGLRARVARPALSVDLAVGLLLNVAVAVAAPKAVQPFAVDVSWTWLIGSVAMWTCAFGIPSALVLLAAAVPVRGLLTVAGGLPISDALALNRSVGCLVGLVVAIVTAAGILVVLGAGARFALNVGVSQGLQAERSRTRRMMHDSVLQTLDALAIATPGDAEHAVLRLAEFRAEVKAEAARLRRRITESQPPQGATRSLVAELAEVATEMARDGLRTQLVAADFEDDALSLARRTAMCDAVREALRNTVKHAGASEVVLRVEERDGGIAVVARDHGRGFDVAQRPAGFGISQSIVARLVEVGGHAVVVSEPGRGTRVTMWVPR